MSLQVDLRQPGIRVELRQPTNPSNTPTVQIHGKTFKITQLRVRNHSAEKWQDIDLTRCPDLKVLAEKCGSIFNRVHGNATHLKTVSLSFEMGKPWPVIGPVIGKSSLQLTTIEYVDGTAPKIMINLAEYGKAAHKELQTLVDPLKPITQKILDIHQKKPLKTLPRHSP